MHIATIKSCVAVIVNLLKGGNSTWRRHKFEKIVYFHLHRSISASALIELQQQSASGYVMDQRETMSNDTSTNFYPDYRPSK